jgi:UTP:GlnB (protein PII) uridylyltransferase
MPSQAPSPDPVSAFKQSLPTNYGERYTAEQIAVHAQIALQRGHAPVLVGGFSDISKPRLGLCVVAKDQPGLLATITSGLSRSGYEITDAEAYTRTTESGDPEAVDIFWVLRKQARPDLPERELSEAEVENLQRQLQVLMLQGVPLPPESGLPRSGPTSETRVRFLESADGLFSTLEVETDDQSGLLQTLASALFASGVQINSSQVRTDGQRVFDRFHILELDGSPISPARRLQIQVAVLGAIQPDRTS